jgi:hypothetical protein
MEHRDNPEFCNEHDQYMHIFESDLSEIDKVARAFDMVTGRVLDHGQKDLEVYKAMGDKESLVKEQIKQETIRFAREAFNQAFKRVMGRSAWDE